jgi:CHASE3 domain sensor protein
VKRLGKQEIAAFAAIGTATGMQFVRVVVHSCRAIRAETTETLEASLAAADGAVQALAEIAAGILDAVE